MKKNKINKGNMLIAVGAILIVAAVFLVGYNLYQSQKASDTSSQIVNEIKANVEVREENDYINSKMEMPKKKVGTTNCIAVVDIPKLGLSLPVAEQWSYPQLKLTPCRYKGSLYSDDFIVAAHNYRNHFGKISKLKSGDDITVTDMNGNVFKYKVDVVDVLEPTAIEEMTCGEWPLTLFTCTPGGSYRVTVRCNKVD